MRAEPELTKEQLIDQVAELVDRLRPLCDGMNTRVLMVAFTEMYARVVSHGIHQPENLERALVLLIEDVRGWWVADRGGPFRPS